ncbi:MAG TPA: hypothetical protein P5159_22265 [Phycisphaerae bacterium]|nr:hypothetical protein [Phycisphaerae bacterium]
MAARVGVTHTLPEAGPEVSIRLGSDLEIAEGFEQNPHRHGSPT